MTSTQLKSTGSVNTFLTWDVLWAQVLVSAKIPWSLSNVLSVLALHWQNKATKQMTVQLYVHNCYRGHNSRVSELDWLQTSRSWSLSWLEIGQISGLAGIILILRWKFSFNLSTSSSSWQRQMNKKGPEETYRHFFRPLLCHFANVAETDHMAEPGGRALQTQKLKWMDTKTEKENTWCKQLIKNPLGRLPYCSSG